VTLNDTIKSLTLGGGGVHVVIDLVSCWVFLNEEHSGLVS
jgi:hypothetical protein